MRPGRSRAKQVPVSKADEDALGVPYDYADAFAIEISESDDRSAEQFARDALEHAPTHLRGLVWNVFRWVLRFELGPRSSPEHLLGWAVVSSSHDKVRLETRSPLFQAVIVGTRPDRRTAKVVTAVAYGRPTSRPLWAMVAPVHRRVARALLRHASAADGVRRAGRS